MPTYLSKPAFVLGIAAVLAACVFVQPTVKGEKVRMHTEPEVDRRTDIGALTANVPDHVGIIPRGVDSVQRDVEQHARNEAAAMDGDTIVPVDALAGGRQKFQVYRCINP